MKKLSPAIRFTLLAFGLLCVTSQSAFAYIGPGAGLTAIGTFVALVGGILLGIVGFVWYPIKRFMKRKSGQAPKADAPESRAENETGSVPSEAADESNVNIQK